VCIWLFRLQELRGKQERIEKLEVDRLSKLPPDTAAEMKAMQDKLVGHSHISVLIQWTFLFTVAL